MFMEALTEFELSPATSFAMAQYARYGHIDPPPDAWLSSQDTVEDLDLYKDQVRGAQVRLGVLGTFS